MNTKIFGTPGASLTSGGFSVSRGAAAAGAAGELRTATVLARVSKSHGCAVLHDLDLPIPGFAANIDHVVVSGSQVLIVDSKVWRPGFYWTFAGKTRRNLTRQEHVDKQTMVLAQQALAKFLARTDARLAKPVVTVWGGPTLWAARTPGAQIVAGERLQRFIEDFCEPQREPDQMIVSRLGRLLKGS